MPQMNSGIGSTEILMGVGVSLFALIIVIWLVQTIGNSRQPIRHLPVRVVAKRTNVGGGMNNMPASTTYYVTFEHENGSREEFPVSGREYGMIAEGDRGTIGRQGTWFKGFRRERQTSLRR